MRLFSRLLDRVLHWSGHKHAPFYLSGLSFSEACVLPFPPPDVMLVPMSLAHPPRAWWYATLTTLCSTLGGLLGYGIGWFCFALIEPVLHRTGYWDNYLSVVSIFKEWGAWAVLTAGLSPIPYKVFTLSAGALQMSLLPFIVASLLGRAVRFFLVAGLMVWGGKKMEQHLRRSVDLLVWGAVVVVVGIYFILRGR